MSHAVHELLPFSASVYNLYNVFYHFFVGLFGQPSPNSTSAAWSPSQQKKAFGANH